MSTSLLPSNNNSATQTGDLTQTAPLNSTTNINQAASTGGVSNVHNTLQPHPDSDKELKKDLTKPESVGFWGAIGNFFCSIGRAIAWFFSWLFGIKDAPTEIENHEIELEDAIKHAPKPSANASFTNDTTLLINFLKIEGSADELLPKEVRKLVESLLQGIAKAKFNREKAGLWNGVSTWGEVAAAYKELQRLKADPIRHLAFAMTRPSLIEIAGIEGRLDNYIGTREGEKYTEGSLGRVLDTVTKNADTAELKKTLRDSWTGFFQYLDLDPNQKAGGSQKTLNELITDRDWNSLVKNLIALRTIKAEEKVQPIPYPFAQIAITQTSEVKIAGALTPAQESMLTDFFKANDEQGRVAILRQSSGLLEAVASTPSPLKSVERLRAWELLLTNTDTRGRLIVLATEKANGKFKEQIDRVHAQIAEHNEAFTTENGAAFCQKLKIEPARVEFALRQGDWDAVIFEALSKVEESKVISPFSALEECLLIGGEPSPEAIRSLSTLTPVVAWVHLLKTPNCIAALKTLKTNEQSFLRFCENLLKLLKHTSNTPIGVMNIEQIGKAIGLETKKIRAIPDLVLTFLETQKK